MELSEFKKENEGKPETVEEAEKKPEVTEEVTEETTEETVDVEPWMKSDEEESEPVVDQEETEEKKNDQIPLKKFMKQKNELRGKVSELTEKDAEIERLKQENESIKANVAPPKTLTRPNQDDFASDDEFNSAIDQYYVDLAQDQMTRNQMQTNQVKQQEEYKQRMSVAVDEHLDRADVMIQKSKIKPDVYKTAEDSFRDIIKSVYGENGDIVADNMIADMGKGSEKVVFYIGKNKTANNEFRSLLTSDPNGIRAAMYLGKQKNKFNNPIKATSNAPDPPTQINGGAPKPAGAQQKQHAKLVAAGDHNEAFAVRRAAKQAGVDVSNWA